MKQIMVRKKKQEYNNTRDQIQRNTSLLIKTSNINKSYQAKHKKGFTTHSWKVQEGSKEGNKYMYKNIHG